MVAKLFTTLVFSGIAVLLINFVISTIIVFFAAQILLFEKNSVGKAILVVLSGFAIGFVQDLFFPVTFFFSWIAALIVFLWAIKQIYEVTYSKALLLWFISIILPIGIAIIVVPVLNRLLVEIVF